MKLMSCVHACVCAHMSRNARPAGSMQVCATQSPVYVCMGLLCRVAAYIISISYTLDHMDARPNVAAMLGAKVPRVLILIFFLLAYQSTLEHSLLSCGIMLL